MYLTRRITSLSYPVIGEKFGGKDHSTVINAEQRIDQLMNEEPDLPRTVQSLFREAELVSCEEPDSHGVDRPGGCRYTARAQRFEAVVRNPKINDPVQQAPSRTESHALTSDLLMLTDQDWNEGALAASEQASSRPAGGRGLDMSLLCPNAAKERLRRAAACAQVPGMWVESAAPRDSRAPGRFPGARGPRLTDGQGDDRRSRAKL